ncbi:alpha/beta hydrolase family protein [Acidocella sp.]|uniref:alpha/beta hydrolase family protein n=1 Tax=Acidocella sp. TaxID=50710 RepID=UPI002F41B552
MKNPGVRAHPMLAAFFFVALGLCMAAPAKAQQEIPPPQGKGPVVVVVSGAMGAAAYLAPARRIAALGYDVVLVDGNAVKGSQGAALKAVVQNAPNAPHGLPGKVGMVGFSLGGGMALFYASRWPDLVSVIVAWYPATSMIGGIPVFVGKIKVPVLMFAGVEDSYHNCCLITTARQLAEAATVQNAPLQLITYPNVGHDFVLAGAAYAPSAASDSWRRATAELAQYLRH